MSRPNKARLSSLRRWAGSARIPFFVFGAIIGTSFGLYFWNLYGQLTQAFFQQDQSIPTRIYGDVSHVAPSHPKSLVEERLKALGYSYSTPNGDIEFTLHPLDYPPYLIPDHHPLLEILKEGESENSGPPVKLHFDSANALQTVEVAGKVLPDLYLEPELAATLSKSGEARREIRTYLKFEDIPAPVWKAIISIEDQHFLDHKGFDPKGIARAVWVNLRTLSLAQGGSTITQQLVKNLMARRTKNIFRKVNELFLALLLETKFDKEQILERYLNEVYLGQVGSLEVHGVAEGAEHFFGKKLNELNLGEIALMAGLIRGPGFYSPYRYKARALERQRLVLKKMVETGQIAEDEASTALKLPIRLAPPQAAITKAPFFSDYVKAELARQLKLNPTDTELMTAGFRVYTTLDLRLNTFAQRAVTAGIQDLEKRMKVVAPLRLEGALASVDHSTGNIKALVGGRNYAESNFNRILNMKRQVGSTFKPLVYLTAFTKGTDAAGVPYAPGHPIEDAPWTLNYDSGKQTWSPKNYEKEYFGWISYRTGLSRSVNVAAAKLGQEVGIGSVIKLARSLGVTADLPEVPSLALGVAEFSPIELLQLYATIANRGFQEELRVIRAITQADGTEYKRFTYYPTQVMDAAPFELLTTVLQDVFTGGTAREARRMGFTRPAAGKTGTTSNFRDAWFAGFTPQLTTVVWVGMDQTVEKDPPNLHLTGANSALPIWVQYMKNALAGEPTVEFPESPRLVEVEIDRHTGKAAEWGCPRTQVAVEKFIRGQEPRDKSCERMPVAKPALEK